MFLITNEIGASVSEDEIMAAIPPAMDKLQRIIQREGDAEGLRLRPQYIAHLVTEQIRSERFAAESQLHYVKKQSDAFCIS